MFKGFVQLAFINSHVRILMARACRLVYTYGLIGQLVCCGLRSNADKSQTMSSVFSRIH